MVDPDLLAFGNDIYDADQTLRSIGVPNYTDKPIEGVVWDFEVAKGTESPLATLSPEALLKIDVRQVKQHKGMKQAPNKREASVAGTDDNDGRDDCLQGDVSNGQPTNGPLPQPLPLTADMLAEISMPPPWYNVPDFSYEPKHGSHGVPPLHLNRNSVSATSASGGFPQFNDPLEDDSNFTSVEQTNIARLATVVWGSNCKLAVTDLLRGNLSTSLNRQINTLVGDRIAATESNPMYFMVLETVDSWNFGVSLENLARIAVRARVPMAGEDDFAVARPENIANAYQAATFDLRSRAITAINDAMSGVSSKYPGKRGQVLALNLKDIRAKFSVDPFVTPPLNPNLVEPLYFEQTRDAKRQFWLTRFDENAVAWFWDFYGLMDIRETIDTQPFGNYCREEFAFVCDTMWSSIIGINIANANLVQSGSVAERALDAYLITKTDQLNYRQHIGIFNEMYNSKHPRAKVRSLGVIHVLEGSIEKPKGFNTWVRQQYIAEVERKMANVAMDEGLI